MWSPPSTKAIEKPKTKTQRRANAAVRAGLRAEELRRLADSLDAAFAHSRMVRVIREAADQLDEVKALLA